MTHPTHHPLSPWPVRAAVYLALVIVAILAIRVIDAHVMQRMRPVAVAEPDAYDR